MVIRAKKQLEQPFSDRRTDERRGRDHMHLLWPDRYLMSLQMQNNECKKGQTTKTRLLNTFGDFLISELRFWPYRREDLGQNKKFDYTGRKGNAFGFSAEFVWFMAKFASWIPQFFAQIGQAWITFVKPTFWGFRHHTFGWSWREI